jgi:hypothetical protein
MLLAITWALRSTATIGSRSSLQFLLASWTFALACVAGQSAIHTISRRSGSAVARAHRRPLTARRTGIWRHLRPRLGRSPRANICRHPQPKQREKKASSVSELHQTRPGVIATSNAMRRGHRFELMHRIRNGQFELARLRVNGKTAPEIWNAVLAA